MILQVSSESSIWVRGAAAFILILHISGGTIGIVSGAAALAFRKGSRLHRLAGNVFFVSMLIMSASGAAVSPFLPVPKLDDAIAGAFTFYLVATAWVTVTRKAGSVGRIEIGALLLALSVTVACLILGSQGATSHSTFSYGVAVISAFAAGGDLKMILRGGVCGAQRIARHLWRMCLALFLAAGSFFIGQQQLFPAPLQRSPILLVPEIVVLALMISWLFRVRLIKTAEVPVNR